MSNCSGSSWRSGAQAPYRSRLGWSAGAFRHVLSSHTGSFLLYLVWELRSHHFYLIKSLCNCTSAVPMSSVPSVKRSTNHLCPDYCAKCGKTFKSSAEQRKHVVAQTCELVSPLVVEGVHPDRIAAPWEVAAGRRAGTRGAVEGDMGNFVSRREGPSGGLLGCLGR